MPQKAAEVDVESEKEQGGMSEFLLRNPFLRFTIALSVGIVIGDGGAVQHHLMLIVAVIVAIGLCIYYHFSKGNLRDRYEYSEPLASMMLLFLVLLLGAMAVTMRQEKDRGTISHLVANGYFDENGDPRLFLLEVREKVERKESRVLVPARLLAYSTDHKSYRKAFGNIMVTLYDSSAAMLKTGDYLCAALRISEHQNGNANPESFDYADYLRRKGYWWTGVVRSDQWVKIQEEEGWSLKRQAEQMQKILVSQLDKICGTGNEDEKAVLSALILGERAELSAELKEHYGNAGIMHVLAVSGLHVGIVGGLVLLLFGLLPGGWRHPMKMFIAALAVWFYSLMTGFAAPVQRAAFMFTVFAVGWSLGRRQQPLNTLCLTAFLLLLYSPNDLFTASFQLSYGAITGIILLYKKLRDLVQIPECLPRLIVPLLKKMRDLTAVGLSAQIGLLPLLLYYFDRVNIYSSLFSVVVIPIAALIIWVAVVTLSLSFVPMVSQAGGSALLLLAGYENRLAQWIEQLPGAVWWHWTNKSEVMLLYALLFFVIGYLYRRKAVWIVLVLISLCVLVVMDMNVRLQGQRTQTWIVYCQYGKEDVSVDFISGRHHTLITNNVGKVEKLAKKWWLRLGCDEMDTISLEEEPVIVRFEEERIAVIREGMNLCARDSTNPIAVDYLIVGGQTFPSRSEVEVHCNNLRLSDVEKVLRPRMVILAAGIPTWKARQWSEECKERGLSFYNLREKGAFTPERGEGGGGVKTKTGEEKVNEKRGQHLLFGTTLVSLREGE